MICCKQDHACQPASIEETLPSFRTLLCSISDQRHHPEANDSAYAAPPVETSSNELSHLQIANVHQIMAANKAYNSCLERETTFPLCGSEAVPTEDYPPFGVLMSKRFEDNIAAEQEVSNSMSRTLLPPIELVSSPSSPLCCKPVIAVNCTLDHRHPQHVKQSQNSSVLNFFDKFLDSSTSRTEEKQPCLDFDAGVRDESPSPMLDLVDRFLSIEGLDMAARDDQGLPSADESKNMNNTSILSLVDGFLAHEVSNTTLLPERQQRYSAAQKINESNHSAILDIVNCFLAAEDDDLISLHNEQSLSPYDRSSVPDYLCGYEQRHSASHPHAKSSILPTEQQHGATLVESLPLRDSCLLSDLVDRNSSSPDLTSLPKQSSTSEVRPSQGGLAYQDSLEQAVIAINNEIAFNTNKTRTRSMERMFLLPHPYQSIPLAEIGMNSSSSIRKPLQSLSTDDDPALSVSGIVEPYSDRRNSLSGFVQQRIDSIESISSTKPNDSDEPIHTSRHWHGTDAPVAN